MGQETKPDVSMPSSLVIGGKEVDGRTIPARRYKAVCADLADDAGGEPSAAQWLLIHRAAGLTVQLEQLEARIASGEQVDVLQFTNLTNALVRVLRTLGLDRRARVISPQAAPVIDMHARAVRASGHG